MSRWLEICQLPLISVLNFMKCELDDKHLRLNCRQRCRPGERPENLMRYINTKMN